MSYWYFFLICQTEIGYLLGLSEYVWNHKIWGEKYHKIKSDVLAFSDDTYKTQNSDILTDHADDARHPV